MIADSFKDSSHFVKLILVLFNVLVGFLIMMIIGLLVAIPLFDIDLSNLTSSTDINNPDNIGFIKYFQTIYSAGIFIVPSLLSAFFLEGKIKEYFGLKEWPQRNIIILSALLIFFGMPLINLLNNLNHSIAFPQFFEGFENYIKKLEEDAGEATIKFIQANTFGTYLINLFVIAVIPALGEELMFRGVLQKLFQSWTKKPHLAIWLAAFIFSAIHFQFYGLLPRMVLGAFFGYLYFWTKNLWVPILIHFFNNAMAITVNYISPEITEKSETVGTGEGAWLYVVFSLVLVSSLYYLLYKKASEHKEIIN